MYFLIDKGREIPNRKVNSSSTNGENKEKHDVHLIEFKYIIKLQLTTKLSYNVQTNRKHIREGEYRKVERHGEREVNINRARGHNNLASASFICNIMIE